jgi:hypothetical protein
MSDCKPNNEHASQNVIDQFIEFAKETNTSRIAISGGEPTEHPKFLDHFENILKSFKNKAIVVLISNGYFLRDEKTISKISSLDQKYQFAIQITAIKEFYPNYKKTIKLFDKYEHRFSNAAVVTELLFFEKHLGRAKNKDWSHLEPIKKREAPNCINIYSVAQSGLFDNLKDVIKYIDGYLVFSLCKPLIDHLGNFRAGEYLECEILGNIVNDSMSDIFQNIKTKKPCGHCKVEIPAVFKKQLNW